MFDTGTPAKADPNCQKGRADYGGCHVIVTNTQPLAGKTAVVTAAGQGIGRAIADRLATDGATVHATDLNADLLFDFEGGHTAALDATDQAAVDAYFDALGQIDVLVHAVGYVHQGTIEECTAAEWKQSVSITLDSAFHVLGAAVPHMKTNGGSVITIASVVGSIKGFPRRAAYGATKAGVIGLTKSVAADYLTYGIRANAICPGTVDSPSLRQRMDALAETLGSREEAEAFFLDRQPSGRLGTPEEIAGLAAYLANDQSALITGQAIAIDGGIMI
ncbi:2-keto-3-deoxy-L-fuconate dehydrogenase [Pelagimonas varians]|uniref:2-keto-3-deoxy-L-fuconate dehydrogenase n=1 Tax=Pelagimonas varians TaxID=696760 RepID=A0A238L0U1_9RHOB|nr:2-keto-3-deoxy-L-fuconate dehydrogenase [Pelagimonas varians]SMX48705.1 2-keto-3-deoxy-L-fuconate dehydrogenase [Pelagimonas varians]